jgi:hypothetical protein
VLLVITSSARSRSKRQIFLLYSDEILLKFAPHPPFPHLKRKLARPSFFIHCLIFYLRAFFLAGLDLLLLLLLEELLLLLEEEELEEESLSLSLSESLLSSSSPPAARVAQNPIISSSYGVSHSLTLVYSN